MSLKHRNRIAWILLLAAAIAWVCGRQTLQNVNKEREKETITTFYPYPEDLSADMTYEEVSYEEATTCEDAAYEIEAGGYGDNGRGRQVLGIVLCLAAILLAVAAIFVLRQKEPVFGPDGVSAFSAIYSWIYCTGNLKEASAYSPVFAAGVLFCVLLSVRELWGWIWAGCRLRWCLLYRQAEKCQRPRSFLLLAAGWIAAALASIVFMVACRVYQESIVPLDGASAVFIAANQRVYPAPLACLFAAEAFGVICLWVYGTDLGHVKHQLDNFQKGLPVEVKQGVFAESEARLLEISAQHEEAVRTAVTSERFKVELIANVSHDLRTPLTSILGYSELLQKETLSPEGRQQLSCLYQKADYMNGLVESLFELTKVSSGVIETKKERIDLIRLLEQTIGLLDDQLVKAGLAVRRHYTAKSVSVVTDGARMHQVFANLLGNAIKYALAGTRIYLEVKENAGSWLVRMTNTSSYEMDFEPEEIVQRFARGDKARSTKGSGLGLAIARTYTESVGGTFRISVDGDQFSAIVELPKTERNL